MTERQRQRPSAEGVSAGEEPSSPATISEDDATGDFATVTLADHGQQTSPPRAHAPTGGLQTVDDTDATLSPERVASASTTRGPISLSAIAAVSDEHGGLSGLSGLSGLDGAGAVNSVGHHIEARRSGPALVSPSGRAGPDSGPGGSAASSTSSRFAVIPNIHYRIDRELARGGMGRILLAYDHRLKREVAIKELLLESSAAQRRFKREALITARLQHPSIVNVYEAGCWPGGEHFYAMERVQGRSFQTVIEGCDSLKARMALLPRVIDIAEALAYAHAQGVIHRDLKPDNVLVGSFGETVVIDWGLAKDLNRPDDEDLPMQDALERRRSLPPGQLTMVGAIMGTPGYMAPEQAEGQEASPASDVYAIGAILYHMLAGKPPFEGETSKQVLLLMLDGPPTPLPQRVPDVPPELVSIVEKAMQRDPAKRYHDAGQLAADLRRFEMGKLVGSHDYSPLDLFRRWLRRYRATLSIMGAAALALLVIAVVSFRQVMKARDIAEQERNIANQERNAAREASARLAIEHQEAVNARLAAEAARADAIAKTNQVALHEARAALSHADPSRALAWLRRLSLDGPGWDSAHLLAVGAWYAGSDDLILRGHNRRPQRLATTRDGRLIASSNADGDLLLWDTAAATGAPPTPLDPASALFALDPLGRWLAAPSRSANRRVAVLDLATRRLTYVKRSNDPEQLLASPDGRLLAIALRGGELSVFEPATGRHADLANLAPLSALAFDPAGQWLAVATAQLGTLTLHRTDSADAVPLPHYDGHVDHLLFSPNGALLLALGKRRDAGTAMLINARTRQPIPTPAFTAPYVEARFSPDSRLLALASEAAVEVFDLGTQPPARLWRHPIGARPLQMGFSAGGRLLLWRTVEGLHAVSVPSSSAAGARLHHLPSIPEVRAFQVVPDSDQVAFIHSDRSVRLLSLSRLARRIDALPQSAPAALFPLPGRAALVVSRAGDLWRWAWDSDLPITPLYQRDPPGAKREPLSPTLSADLSPDRRWLLLRRSTASGAASEVEVWSLPDDAPPSRLSTLRDAVSAPTLLPTNPPKVAYLIAPRRVRVAAADGAPAQTVTLPDLPRAAPDGACAPTARRMRASPDGRTLALIYPCEAALWLVDVASGEARGLEFPESEALSDVVFSADGRTLVVAAGQAGTLFVDRETWRRKRLFENAHDAVTLSLSPSGRWLAADASEETLRVWDLLEGRVVADLNLPSRTSEPVLWSHDSRWLVTTHDGAARVWGVVGGEFREVQGGGGHLTSAAWDLDSPTLLTASSENALRAWPDDLPQAAADLHAWLQASVTLTIDDAGLPTSLPLASPPP
jgi:serine/threonine protein kinase/WD40 repeat protein